MTENEVAAELRVAPSKSSALWTTAPTWFAYRQ